MGLWVDDVGCDVIIMKFSLMNMYRWMNSQVGVGIAVGALPR